MSKAQAEANIRHKARAKLRAVRKSGGNPPSANWEFFDRVSSTRYKLKADASRTMYAVACLLADEHDLMVTSIRSSIPDDVAKAQGYVRYHRNAAAALRMMADRLIKSFDLRDLIRAERYAMEEWSAALAAFTKSPRSRSADDSKPVVPEGVA